MEKELNASLEKFPFEYPIRVAFKEYARRLVIFLIIVFINLILLSFVILLIKEHFLLLGLCVTVAIFIAKYILDIDIEKEELPFYILSLYVILHFKIGELMEHKKEA